MDMEVRTTAGEEIGEIEDVIFSRKGKVKEFVIDVGGFLVIGEIENLVVDRRGRITHVIIDVGGFLGIGDKQVAVPFDRLEDIGPYFVMYPGTEAQLESMSAFDQDKLVGTKKREKLR
jgi:sporulation protein YlmC with PRC-barrel domain